MKKLGEQVVESIDSTKDYNKLIVTNASKYLGFDGTTVSGNIGLYKIGTLIAYNINKPKKIKHPKAPGIGRNTFRVPMPTPGGWSTGGIIQELRAEEGARRRDRDQPPPRATMWTEEASIDRAEVWMDNPQEPRTTQASSQERLARLRDRENRVNGDIARFQREINNLNRNSDLGLYNTEVLRIHAETIQQTRRRQIENAQRELGIIHNEIARINRENTPQAIPNQADRRQQLVRDREQLTGNIRDFQMRIDNGAFGPIVRGHAEQDISNWQDRVVAINREIVAIDSERFNRAATIEESFDVVVDSFINETTEDTEDDGFRDLDFGDVNPSVTLGAGAMEAFDRVIMDEIKKYSFTTGDKDKEELKELSYKEKRKQAFSNFRNNFGGCPTIIKGYLIRDKVYTSNEDIIANIGSTPNNKEFSTIIKVYYLDDKDELCTKIITVKNLQVSHISKNNLYIIPYLFKLRIKSSEDSGIIFGLAKEKKALEGEYIQNWEIETVNPKKLSKSSAAVVVIRDEDKKKVKFLFNDCEFINPELKGYTCPTDRTILYNSIVKIIDKKLSKYGVTSCDEAVVISTKSNPSSKVISKQCRNHRMDIITIRLLQGDRIITVHAQDLKLIKQNKTNDYKEKKSTSGYQTYNTEDILRTWARTGIQFTTGTTVIR